MDSPLFLALLLRFSGFGSLSMGALLSGSAVFFRPFLAGAGFCSSSTASGIDSGSFDVTTALDFFVRVNGKPSDTSSYSEKPID